jgi:hypothetical protein
VYFAYRALAGDPDYASFWERAQSNPEKTVYHDTSEGLKLIEMGSVIMHTEVGLLKGFLKEHPFFSQGRVRSPLLKLK